MRQWVERGRLGAEVSYHNLLSLGISGKKYIFHGMDTTDCSSLVYTASFLLRKKDSGRVRGKSDLGMVHMA